MGAVSYLNTKPLLYGIERSPIRQRIELTIDYPSRIADMLLRDEIDTGLVPVAIIPSMQEYYLHGNFCIGCDGPVASVCLFSEVPVGEIRTVLLDYQSRTSAALARILLNEHWRVQPGLTDGGQHFQREIRGTTAGLVIGDRAFQQRQISPFVYDLGQAWKDFTGLPFVFAAWISNKPLDPDFVREFDEANEYGVRHIDTVVRENPFELFDLRRYFTTFLDYHLDKGKLKGLDRFLQYLDFSLMPAGYSSQRTI